MEKAAHVLVKHRRALCVVVVALALASAFLIPSVRINRDMAEYLPDSSQMSVGLEVSEAEFPDDDEGSVRVMFTDLPEQDFNAVEEALSQVEGVESVDFDADDEAYREGPYTLFELAAKDSDAAEEVGASLRQALEGYEFVYETGGMNASLPPFIIAIAVVVVLGIMLVMCSSWVEPVVFLVTIGIAIVLNMGTNAFAESVSATTNGIAAILQLVLSIDYSIMVSNRFRQAREHIEDRELALERALTASIPSVFSSSLTTIFGLLALVFMSFKIGADLGFVLAKGVFFSLLCVFTVLPTFILGLERPIARTAKRELRIPTDGLAKVSFRARHVLVAVFAVVFVAAFVGKAQAGISYAMPKIGEVTAVFPEESRIVVLYDNADEEAATELAEQLEGTEGVSEANAFGTTLGKAYTAEELVDEMGSDDIDLETARMVYYAARADRTGEAMRVSTLVSMLDDPDVKDKLGEEGGQSGLPLAGTMVSAMTSGRSFTAGEMADFLSGVTDELDQADIDLLFCKHFSEERYDESWTLTIGEFLDTLLDDASFSQVLGDGQRDSLAEARQDVSDAESSLVGPHMSRLVVSTSLAPGSDEIMALVEHIEQAGDAKLAGEHYYIGDAVLAFEMQHSFGAELDKITLITIAVIFLVVLVTFRSAVVAAILVLLIQGAVFVTMALMGLIGYDMIYLALLITQCILMGATIDYAIVFTSYYRESRGARDILESLKAALRNSIRTIATSGLIMVFATAVLGFAYNDATIGPICRIISAGVTSAIVMIIVFLPAILATLDKLVARPAAPVASARPATPAAPARPACPVKDVAEGA